MKLKEVRKQVASKIIRGCFDNDLKLLQNSIHEESNPSRLCDHEYCAVAPYPQRQSEWVDEEAESLMSLLQETLTMARNARHESGLPIQKKAPLVVLTDHKGLAQTVQGYEKELKRMAQLTDLSIAPRQGYNIPAQAAVNSGVEMDVLILLEGLIDLAAERERLAKEVEKLDKRRQSLGKRLNNPGFRDRAPEKVIKETEGNLRDVEEQIARLEERIGQLNS